MWDTEEDKVIGIQIEAEESSDDDSNWAPTGNIFFCPNVALSVLCVMKINLPHISCFARSFYELWVIPKKSHEVLLNGGSKFQYSHMHWWFFCQWHSCQVMLTYDAVSQVLCIVVDNEIQKITRRQAVEYHVPVYGLRLLSCCVHAVDQRGYAYKLFGFPWVSLATTVPRATIHCGREGRVQRGMVSLYIVGGKGECRGAWCHYTLREGRESAEGHGVTMIKNIRQTSLLHKLSTCHAHGHTHTHAHTFGQCRGGGGGKIAYIIPLLPLLRVGIHYSEKCR